MDFSSLLSDSLSSPSIIEEGIDPQKHAKITSMLCEKRKLLEQKIASKELTDDKGTDVIELMQLKNSMTLFGISEIDYQAYLTRDNSQKNKESTAVETHQNKTPNFDNTEMAELDKTG